MAGKKYFIPALHYHWLTRFYDPLMQGIMPDRKFKDRLLQQAGIQSGETVLDFGCGTGTFTLLIKQSYSDADVIGLDIDPQVLHIAHNKAQKAEAQIAWHLGTATRLPYPDQSIDRILTTFVFHHLAKEDKQRAAAEAFRILRHGGELHVLDFGKPHSAYTLLISYLMRWTEELLENMQGLLPDIFRAAGFSVVEEREHFSTLFGSVSLYQARKA